MSALKHLFENNKKWAQGELKKDPNFFKKLAEEHNPDYLWIGCADSRVPANEILGLDPGELFVHRNVANLFPHTDFNCLSALQYGVESLGIEHVIVCGHYGCGGVAAAMDNVQLGLVENWLRHIRDIYFREKGELDQITDPKLKYNRLVELNVIYQVMNVCHTTIVQNTWERNKPLTIHGWVYGLETGLLKDLNCSISSIEQYDPGVRPNITPPLA